MDNMNNNKQNEKECKPCKMNRTMMAISIAHLSCSTIKDEEKKGNCMAWAADLDPSQVKDTKQIMEEAYAQSGIKGLAAPAALYNELVKELVIEKVGEKIERGEEVTDDEMKAYKEFTEEDQKKGI